MKTYQFSFKGRNRFIDAEDIFAALLAFHSAYKGIPITEIHIKEI